MPLEGATTGDGSIDAYDDNPFAENLVAHSTRRVTFRLSVTRGAVTTAATGSALNIETDLDQFDLGSGSATTLDYAGPRRRAMRVLS